MNAIVSGEYVTFKHIKTRKMVVLEIEVAEENFQDVITKLGMPIGGQSKPVAVALLAKPVISKMESASNAQCDCNKLAQAEGDKLRVRAVMVAKDKEFQLFSLDAFQPLFSDWEANATQIIYNECNIKSRSELAINQEAQNLFKELLTKFDTWKLESQYKDNLYKM